ncbi:MAG: helix-hairpin-helix domain-containing protein [Vicinamibacteraceae bacterium]
MRDRFLLSAGAALLAFLAASGSASAQTQLPDGPGKAEVQKLCSTCHPADRGASVRLTREGWQDVMTRMVGLGLKGTDEELNAALEYLATHFKGEAAAPLNLNRATPVQLQSVAGLLRAESAALIAHRGKAPCKTLDDLKSIAGLDFTKIEKRRDRLVCF